MHFTTTPGNLQLHPVQSQPDLVSLARALVPSQPENSTACLSMLFLTVACGDVHREPCSPLYPVAGPVPPCARHRGMGEEAGRSHGCQGS